MNTQINDKEIYRLGTNLSLWFIFIAGLGFLILLLPLFFENYNFEILGSLGDATGGFLNPIVAIAAAMLTFLAFYVQYQANQQVREQFLSQQVEDAVKFDYNKLKERLHLVIHEIENFDVAFHKKKLITQLSKLQDQGGKKYNFSGVQGINLFLIEYFRHKKEQEEKNKKQFRSDDSFHAIMLSIDNLIILYYETYLSVQTYDLPNRYSEELKDLMAYVYYSKLSYIFEQYLFHKGPSTVVPKILYITQHYSPETFSKYQSTYNHLLDN